MAAFFRGVIEGFYGRQWSWQSRHDYADFLKANGYHTYIYAPKGDAYLRSRWRESWPADHYQQLQKLSKTYRAAGLEWGVGLSPLDLFRDYNADQKTLLLDKITAINALDVDVLCILFDDMPGEFPQLAQQQLAIINDVLATSTARKHIVCPTYYSFDPVLEEVFGVMPVNYLKTLGQELPADIHLFWTGDKVISPELTVESIRRAADALDRKPVIWDNWLANDGRNTADFLRIADVGGRSSELAVEAAGHLLNPMNQPTLSTLALAQLAKVYSEESTAMFSGSCSLALGQPLLDCLRRDQSLFSAEGLAQINDRRRLHLGEEYAKINHPIAAEICDWLAGGYCFDPDCLTG